MSTRERLLLLLAFVLVVFAGWMVARHRRTLPPALTDLQVAERWLQCIDCGGPYLAQLSKKRGDGDTVVRFLRAALLQGPDSARLARHEREVLQAWVRDSAYRVAGGPHLAAIDSSFVLQPVQPHLQPLQPQHGRVAFVARYQRGFEAKWRGRAAFALSAIGTPGALAALDSALLIPPTSQGDSAVRKWIEQAKSDSALIALRQPD